MKDTNFGAITGMDGNFFSLYPRNLENMLYSFHHVDPKKCFFFEANLIKNKNLRLKILLQTNKDFFVSS